MLMILSLALAIAFAVLLYFTFRPEKCENFECFQQNMIECKPAFFINEETQAAWNYEIKGKKNGECEIEVTLLLAKEGELGIDRFEGNSMICFYPEGVSAYPDKDLALCHGRLKEDLQGIIIEKLHTYVLENLGEIKEGLGRI